MTDAEGTRLLAEKLMGWTASTGKFAGPRCIGLQFDRPNNIPLFWWETAEKNDFRTWNPTVSISDAFMLVDKMLERGFEFTLFTIGNNFNAAFTLPKDRDVPRQSDLSESATATCAIVLACIEVLKGEKQ